MEYSQNVFKERQRKEMSLFYFLWLSFLFTPCCGEKSTFINKNISKVDSPSVIQETDKPISGADVNNLPRLTNIIVINDNIIWAVNSHDGGLINTTNGGISWQKSITPINNPIEALYFLNQNQGWIVDSQANVMFTDDSGNNWTSLAKLKSRNDDPNFISAVQVLFNNEQDGLIVENFTVRRTMDAGRNWKITFSTKNQLEEQPEQIEFVNNNTGYLRTGNGVIYKTKDKGNSWTSIFKIKEETRDSKFVNNDVGWLATQQNIYLTKDGGQHWRKYKITDDNIEILSLDFRDTLNGWIVGYITDKKNMSANFGRGFVFKSSNGGIDWKKIDINYPEKLFSKVICRNKIIWIFGKQNLYKSTDDGQSWQILPLP